jgi:hypothetical protein
MIKTDLNIIEADSGSVYHALKNTDKGFKQFGEIYLSSLYAASMLLLYLF